MLVLIGLTVMAQILLKRSFDRELENLISMQSTDFVDSSHNRISSNVTGNETDAGKVGAAEGASSRSAVACWSGRRT